MKISKALLLFLIQFHVYGQVSLISNGPGNSYEEITQVLAPGYDPIEAPDCNHSSFGRHIDEIFDNSLNKYVFRFFLHTTPDNDRCINFDRQRNEIKAYDKSPDNLLGTESETVEYKWKFKIDQNFQVSSKFTHIHQLKSVGGSLASMPMYTITLRKSNPDRLELRYAETSSQMTLKQTDLSAFRGQWVEVTETIKYGQQGTYKIVINRVSDGVELFSYQNSSIINWRSGADFVRPKWGIYRSLENSDDLRDEEVLFADFVVTELDALSVQSVRFDKSITLIPNPTKGTVEISLNDPIDFTSIEIRDSLGKIVKLPNKNNKRMDVSSFSKGVYLVMFKKNLDTLAVKRLVIE